MSNITINAKRNEIVITKAFEKKASQFNTPEYKDLQEVRRDYPNFRVVVSKTSAKKDNHKGLDFNYMKKYIAEHDDENGTLMNEFNSLKGTDEMKGMSYGEIREWFLVTFPEVDEILRKREKIMNRVKAQKAAMLKVA